jgi:hypothetical protein
MTDEDLAAHLTEAKLTLSSEKSITARQVKHIREKADIKKTAAKRV